MHDALDNVAIAGIAVRPNRAALESGSFDVRPVRVRDRKHGRVSAPLQRQAKPDVGVQIAKRSDRRQKHAHWRTIIGKSSTATDRAG
jgi:hypothetical protein